MVKNKICAIVNLTENAEALKPLTNMRPIAALPFASRYRIIDFVLSNVRHADINSVALFIAESGRSIYDHVRSGAAWDLDSLVSGGIFTFSQQDWKLRHLAENENEDFYYNHRLFMSRSKCDYVFVTGSKIIANVDISAVLKAHEVSGADITTLYRQIGKDFLGVSSNKGRALVFDENRQVVDVVPYESVNPADKINGLMSMSILSVAKFNELIDQAIEDGVYVEADELIRRYLLTMTVNPYEYTGYAANIDTMERYYEANMQMLDRTNFNALLNSSLPVLTKTKNGVPTYYAPEADVRESLIATGTSISGLVHDSVIYRRVTVAQNAKVCNAILLQGVSVGEGAEIRYAILDKGSIVKPGAKVLGTPDKLIVIGRNEIVEA